MGPRPSRSTAREGCTDHSPRSVAVVVDRRSLVCTAMVPEILLALPMALEVIHAVRFDGGLSIALDSPLSFPWLTPDGIDANDPNAPNY